MNTSRNITGGWSRSALVVLLLGLSLLAGCAGLQRGASPEEIVQKRAQQRIDLLIAGKVEESFRFATPSYQKGRGLKYYTRAHAGVANWNKAEVRDVTCSGTRCEVSLRVWYPAFQGSFEHQRSMEERWIEVDGHWYLYLR